MAPRDPWGSRKFLLPDGDNIVNWTLWNKLKLNFNEKHPNFHFRTMYLKMLKNDLCITRPCTGVTAVLHWAIKMQIYFYVTKINFLQQEFTLSVQGPSYLGLTRSISWLQMPWLLTSPGHQQPWYWLYRICRSCSYLRKDFKYLCQINVEEWHKM